MIQLSNYAEQINTNLLTTKTLKEGHKFITEFGSFYNEDHDVKKAIDNHLNMVNQLVNKSGKSTAKPTKKGKSDSKTQFVRTLAEDVKIIKAFASLQGKDKSFDQIVSFHRRLLKNVAMGNITKESKYANLLIKIKSKVDALLPKVKEYLKDTGEKKVKINFTDADLVNEIKGATKEFESVKVFKSLVSLHGTTPDKKRVDNLLNRIDQLLEKSPKEPFVKEIKEAKHQLELWKTGEPFGIIVNSSLNGNETVLNGLGCAMQYCECMPQESLNGLLDNAAKAAIVAASAMTVHNHIKNNKEPGNFVPAANANSQTTPDRSNGFIPANQAHTIESKNVFRLDGEIGKFLQDIQREGYAITLIGPRGGGKTTFCVQTANCWIDSNMRVGWLSLEQGGLESKDTVGAINKYVSPENKPNLLVTGEAEKGIETVREVARNFDVLITDSWGKLNADPKYFDSLRKEFPETIFMTIFQSNAAGKMRGGNSAEYDAMVVLEIFRPTDRFEDNYVKALKNRGNSIDYIYNISEQKTYHIDEYIAAGKPL